MYNPSYIAIILFCIGIASLILLKVQTSLIMLQKKKLFALVISLFILTSIFAGVSGYLNGKPSPLAFIIHEVSIAAYYCIAAFLTFNWYRYFSVLLYSKYFTRPKVLLLTAIPLVISIILVLSSFKTQFIFYVDTNNHFHQGPLFIVYFLINCLYISLSMYLAFRYYLNKHCYIERKPFLMLALLGFVVLFGTFAQMILPGNLISIPAFALTIFLTYFITQTQLIIFDDLTGVYNKNQLSFHLNHFLNLEKDNYLYRINIKGFKEINKKFSSLEGDNALKILARILQKESEHSRFFVNRYSKDVFNVVANFQTPLEAESFASTIQKELNHEVHKIELPYPIALQIAYVPIRAEDTVYDMFKRLEHSLHPKNAVK